VTGIRRFRTNASETQNSFRGLFWVVFPEVQPGAPDFYEHRIEHFCFVMHGHNHP